jgi:hypothetical protein
MQDDLIKRRTCGLLAATATAAMCLGAQPATAQDSGPTESDDVCMQQVFGGDTVTNANRLNCTANDVRISGVAEDEEGNPLVTPLTCIEGETFTLTATFEVEVTANARYDTGFFFRTDGGDDARDPDGTCSLSKLDPNLEPGEDLDGDTCGDLNAGTYEATFTIPNVECEGVPDPDNPGVLILSLPNCTSWHSNQGTTCAIGDANSFAPDTKSKCVCDDDFTVPVVVETATLLVDKQASPATVSELGGTVTYTVFVTNEANAVSVKITTLEDDIYGDLTDPLNGAITDSTCGELVGDVLGPQGSGTETASCSFTAFVDGNADDLITDVATVCGEQTNTNAVVCDDDYADVTITDVQTAPALDKTAQAAGCTVDTTYQVVVTNNSEVDFLTVDALEDDPFGDITTVQGGVIDTTCETGGVIDPLDNYTCTFVGRAVSANCSIDQTDTVTGTVTDDDGLTSTPTDSATVKVDVTFP